MRPLRLALAFLLSAGAALAEPLVKSGEKIAFLGDSITAAGAAPTGYVRMVERGLATAGIEIVVIPAGVSGHKSDQMLARLEKDVLSKQPDWLALNCGVNDVWHRERGLPLDAYRANITAIVDRAQAAGLRVLLMTFTPIYEDLDYHLNQTAVGYQTFLRELATEKGCVLADLDADFRAAYAAAPRYHKKHNRYTTDGVHPNLLGHQLMAQGVLRALGLDDAQLAAATAALEAEPGLARPSGRASLSLADYKRLVALADAERRPVADLLDDLTAKAVADHLAAHPRP